LPGNTGGRPPNSRAPSDGEFTKSINTM
jgi:hypothetical protein